MTLASSLTGVKITDNIIDIGRFSTGSSPVSYTYDSSMRVGGSAYISGNTISGCVGGSTVSTPLISITSGSAIITNNHFIRGSSPLNYYILVSSGNSQIITDNIFDSSTVDGTIEKLVTTLPIGSAYERNINQIIYIPVPLGSFSNSPVPNDATNFKISTDGISIVQTNNSHTKFTCEAGTARAYFSAPLNIALPNDIKVLKAKLGLWAFDLGGTSLSSSNFINISLISENMGTVNYDLGDFSILDVKNSYGLTTEVLQTSYDIDVNFASLLANSQYIEIDAISSTNFIVGNEASINLTTEIVLSLASGPGIELSISPYIIKCIW